MDSQRAGRDRPGKGGGQHGNAGRSRQKPRKRNPRGNGQETAYELDFDPTAIFQQMDPNATFVVNRPQHKEPKKPKDNSGSFKTHLTEAVDPWDAQNQQQAKQLEAQFANGDLQTLYEQLQARRENERKEMENRGLVDRQDTRKNLSDALVFVGTCQEMCPVFERVRRTYENNVMGIEKGPNGRVTPDRAVKAFSRPAAGQPPPLPSDVRPPSVLLRTLSYLIDTVVPRLPQSHAFLWDRTRSIRQDFTYQNYAGPEAVACNEMIARIHIVSLHVMAGSGMDYSRQQELEQFNKSLQSLSEFYGLHKSRTLAQFPNEPEMRAYQLLSHLKDTELDSKIDKLPDYISENPLVKLAKELRAMLYRLSVNNDYAQFFQRIKSQDIPVTFQCLLEVVFVDVRINAIRALSKAMNARSRFYSFERFVQILSFDSYEEAIKFCNHYDLPLSTDESGQQQVNIKAWKEDASKAKPAQPCSQWITQRLSFSVITTSIAVPTPMGSTVPRSAAPAFRPQAPRPAQAPRPVGTAFSMTTPAFFNGQANPTPQTSVPSKAAFKQMPPVMATPVPTPTIAPVPEPPKPVEPVPVAPPPKPKPQRPSEADFKAQVDEMMASAVSQIVKKVAQKQTLAATLRKKNRVNMRSKFITNTTEAILEHILNNVVHSEVRDSVETLSFRHKWDKRLLVSRIKSKAAHALKLRNRVKERELEIKNGVDLLSQNIAPRVSQRKNFRESSVGSELSIASPPSPEADLEQWVPSTGDKTRIHGALVKAWSKGAKSLSILVDDWTTELGQYLLDLFDLVGVEGLYIRTFKISDDYFTVSSDANDADIVISDGPYIGNSEYILEFPHFNSAAEIVDTLEEFIAAVPNQDVSDMSTWSDVDPWSRTITSPRPLKRLASSMEAPDLKSLRSLHKFHKAAPAYMPQEPKPKARESDTLQALREAIASAQKFL